MINIKCLNKKHVYFSKYAGKENCTKNVQPFYKQIKESGWKVFLKNLPPELFSFAYIS